MGLGASGSVYAVGLMSGTSMDGVDAALIRTDGLNAVERLAFVGIDYDAAFRDRLRAAMAAALALPRPGAYPAIDAAARELTLRHAQAVAAVLARAGVPAADVAVVGFHGQTVAHRPERGWTWQIGDGALLAAATGIPVVGDFRSADVAAGGQGAPLAPAYHRALAAPLLPDGPVAVLNLGGVGNITWFGGGEWGSFDTGPANALIDDWVLNATGRSHDAGGALAATGAVHDDVLTAMLDNPWFDQPPPKSLDRADFSGRAPEGGLGRCGRVDAAEIGVDARRGADIPARLLQRRGDDGGGWMGGPQATPGQDQRRCERYRPQKRACRREAGG